MLSNSALCLQDTFYAFVLLTIFKFETIQPDTMLCRYTSSFKYFLYYKQGTHNHMALGSSLLKALHFVGKCVLNTDQSFIGILVKKNCAVRIASFVDDTADDTLMFELIVISWFSITSRMCYWLTALFIWLGTGARLSDYIVIVKISSQFGSLHQS